ncbi:hypothetical protein BG011_002900 [Mortierella polycephala]|uniref:Uncharacterized protein n=1 Tax=Mortierella polycephala TaxID=41804 RepID=A0A9P6UAF0_9FUNG|nr:hypothetical protein BG011_002900 [Mortierella polycephala]
MPLLLLATPLRKSWLGVHYWKPPSIMELPVELEYIPCHEFEDRFERLNGIARPVYPTMWPNVLMLLVFASLFATAAVGITRSGSSLSIMSQGACFILPVIAVLWVRIRKEAKSKARKKFKHRTQKMLRSWTAQDVETHAIQWKLRLRLKSTVSRRRRGLHGAQQQEDVTPIAETRDMNAPPSVTIQMEGQDTLGPGIATPRRTADVYTALRNPTLTTTATRSTATITTTTMPSSTSLRASPHQQAQLPPAPVSTSRRSKWDPWKELFRDLYCCAYVFREPRIWMIEISIRESLMDEYALPVPSPVYCDYRLPGYDDVMAGNVLPRTPSSSLSPTVGLTGSPPSIMSTQPRYSGSPPAYQSDDSDSESESEDGDEEADGIEVDGDEDQDSIYNRSRDTLGTGSTASNSVGGAAAGGTVGTASAIPVTTSGTGPRVHHPIEMTTVTMSSRPVSSHRDSEDTHTRPVRSILSMSTLAASASTSRTTLHASQTGKEDSAGGGEEGGGGTSSDTRGSADKAV